MLQQMNVQKMVPFLHSELFSFEFSPSALIALPDIFMTTLCPLWVLQLSRIYLTCTPCKYCCQTQFLVKGVHISAPCYYLDITVCVSGCCEGRAWCRTFPSLRRQITLRVCEWTWVQHVFLLVLFCVAEINLGFHFQDPFRNQDIVCPRWSLWGSQVASNAVRDFFFFCGTCSSFYNSSTIISGKSTLWRLKKLPECLSFSPYSPMGNIRSLHCYIFPFMLKIVNGVVYGNC